jgi:hypothetical protein
MASGTGPRSIFTTFTSVGCLSVVLLLNFAAIAAAKHPGAIDPAMSSRWTELLQRTPYPYHQPLPPETLSPIDGTYVKFDPKPFPHVPCRRCPDYVPEGGIWKLQFDLGIMRIFHAETGWRSISSFRVEGDQLYLFNDPHCINTVGVYHWRLHEGQLSLERVDDVCAIQMRGKNLSKQPWQSCQSPDEEAATTGHWPAPPGCE